MKLNAEPFEMIKSGKKIYELRLFDEKRQLIKSGDQIEFSCTKSQEKLLVSVVGVLPFSSFADLYSTLSPLEIGYTEQNFKTATPLDMQKYYLDKEQEKYGVVAIKIQRV